MRPQLPHNCTITPLPYARSLVRGPAPFDAGTPSSRVRGPGSRIFGLSTAPWRAALAKSPRRPSRRSLASSHGCSTDPSIVARAGRRSVSSYRAACSSASPFDTSGRIRAR